MPAPTPPPLASKNSGLATASLVLGILSLALVIVCVGPVLGIPAVIFGHIALSQIKRSGGALCGSGLAIAGLVTGYLSLALIPLLVVLAIPNFVKARDTAQKNVCIHNLRLIDHAKQQWAMENNKQADAVPTPEDLDRYIPGGYAHLHCPRGGEYVIGQCLDAPTCSIPGHQLRDSQSDAPSDPQFNPRSSRSAPSQPAMNSDQLREAMKIAQCKANLRTIASAKRIWQMRNHKQTGDMPSEADIMRYLPARHLPECPDGGTYEIGAIGEDPTCSVTGHQLQNGP